MKILIFGGRGYLGEHFKMRYPDAITPSLDIADREAVKQALEQHQPDVVINAAGKTGRPNVDWCEEHKGETLHANVTGPLILLEECQERNIYLVHLSSGCIYQGDNKGMGFMEDEEPNFAGSYYSRTKAWAEALLKEFPVLILRLRMPFDNSTNERNLLMKVRKFAKVNDVENSITYLPDFIDCADALIKKRATGIYNVVNPGAISPYHIIELYKQIVDMNHQAERVALEELGALSKVGRSNCILSTRKLEAEGLHMRPAEEVVKNAWESIKTALKE